MFLLKVEYIKITELQIQSNFIDFNLFNLFFTIIFLIIKIVKSLFESFLLLIVYVDTDWCN